MTTSTARGQRCLHCGATYPLSPPVIGGCPRCATESFRSPLEVVYDYPPAADWLPESPLPGLARYAPVLPPIVPWLSLGEGGTPLVPYPPRGAANGAVIYIKDESRNPTWSHKDRLNFVVVSTALNLGAPGIVAASSGNHGGSAAAYAARAGLPAVILTTPRPPCMASFLQAYGQVVVAVSDPATRWTFMDRIIAEMGYHPASNQSQPPTNHPFGSEGYKTIAYELYLQLGKRAPAAVCAPVGYAELLFGVYKGFTELQRYGLIAELPRMVGCEPAAGAPLKRAIEQGVPVAEVRPGPTDAYAIGVPVNSYRGVVAIRESGGMALAIPDEFSLLAQTALSRAGMWAELSSAVAVAGALQAAELGLRQSGPIVAISTSSGFKDIHAGEQPVPFIGNDWDALRARIGGD